MAALRRKGCVRPPGNHPQGQVPPLGRRLGPVAPLHDNGTGRRREGTLSSSDQLRRQLTETKRKRSDEEGRLADARKRQTKKESDAASYRSKAARTWSDSMRKSYLRNAESAEKAARSEADKVSKHTSTVAGFAKKEADLSKRLTDAQKREAEAEDRAGKRREQEERRSRERERRQDVARTEGLVSAAQERMAIQLAALRRPRPEPLRVLYVTASPGGDLRVDEEIRRVKNAVRAATHRDLVEIEHLPAATTSDLLDALAGFRPHVVHFSGHAAADVLEFDTGADTHGPGHAVTAQAFARAIAAVDEPATLVLLNACDSEPQLGGLLSVVPLALGMNDAIHDPDAMTFAARFYRNLADGQSVGSSFEAARTQLEFDGLTDAELPVLAVRDGVDAADVRLVVPPE